jgi:hypothetical protein
MKAISTSTVQKACLELEHFSEPQMAEEASRFIRHQPNLVDFLKEFTEDSHTEIQQLALYLSYLIWKIFTIDKKKKFPQIPWEVCYQCFIKERRLWKENQVHANEKNLQPNLILYIQSFFEKDSENLKSEEVEKGALLILLRSVIAAFDKVADQ